MIEWILSSSVLILIVIAARYLLKGHIRLRLQYALWLLVLLRLLLPVSFGESRMSVINALPEPEAGKAPFVVGLTIPAAPAAGVPVADGEITGYPVSPTEEAAGTAARADWGVSWKHVWIGGTVLAALGLLGANLHFAGKLRKGRKRLDAAQCPLPVYLSDAVDSPCLFGLLRPGVYLTAACVQGEAAFRHVLAHEYSHYRQGDHVWALLRCACLALHWYNPLVWLAAVLSRRDAELSCDEATIKRLGEGERMAYGRTLIDLSCGGNAAVLLAATTMTGGKRMLKERIRLIARHPKTTAVTLAAALLAALFAAGCTFTGAAAGAELSPAPELSQETAAPEKLAQPYLSVFVPTAETWHEIPVSKELDEEFLQEISAGKKLEDVSPVGKEGWGQLPPQGTDYFAILYHDSNGDQHRIIKNSAGRYGTLAETDANETIAKFMARIAEETGWGAYNARAAYTELTRIDLVYEGETVISITDAERLRAFETLVTQETYAVFGAANRTPTVLELRCTRSDGAQLSLTVDPEDCRLWIPPFTYYRYNAPESTGTKPLLDALGLSDWPVEAPEGYREIRDENFGRLMQGPFYPAGVEPRKAAGMDGSDGEESALEALPAGTD